MGSLFTLRTAVFTIAVLLSLVILAICVVVKNPLGLAACIVTIVSLSTMYIFDQLRDGMFTSMIAFETAWTFILWIIWATVAGLAVEVTQFCPHHSKEGDVWCNMYKVACALAFIVWFDLLAYQTTLSVYAVIAASRSRGVWTWSVHEVSCAHAPMTAHPYPSRRMHDSKGYGCDMDDLPIQLPVDPPYEPSFRSESSCPPMPAQPQYTYPGASPRSAQSPTLSVGSPQSSYYFTAPNRHASMRSFFSSYTYREKGLPALPEDPDYV
ncbi:hypothetical protein BV22DRAFT_1125020 [Leucogyrophana mollusca]|uniref:Uncharacterized protein n=1 Tax=Leucogyrophana mollusca TaxID=85980 RepID=A0ACB8BWJ0_9AGAM|nr:hypothetical protein BV22DRAFT_1125020 [Leucogyrophana mollusca]